MKDSTTSKQDEPSAPIERPSWQFSGRRGTPVHLREQAPATLPAEIRKAVSQLARERAGERAPAADARPVRAGADLDMTRRSGQAPPVAAAPMPVERRTGAGVSGPVVGTSPIEPAIAPSRPVTPAASTLPARPEAARPPAEVTESKPVGPQAVARTQPDAVDARPQLGPERAPSTPPAKPTPATEVRAKAKQIARAKARAKANAKAKAQARKAKPSRTLFARGRSVDAAAAAAIEPVEPIVEPSHSDTPRRSANARPKAADLAPTAAVAPALARDTPEAVELDHVKPLAFPTHADAAHAPDLEPGTHAEATVDIEPTADEAPVQEADVEPCLHGPEIPGPALAVETARQAAWDLGRLPILLEQTTSATSSDDASSSTTAPAVASVPVETVDDDPTNRGTQEREQASLASEPAPHPAEAWVSTAAVQLPPPMSLPPARPRGLEPIDWLPVGLHPIPAPIEPLGLPERPVPAGIARLADGLDLPGDRSRLARAGARERIPAASRTLDANQRVANRRAELGQLMDALAALGTSEPTR